MEQTVGVISAPVALASAVVAATQARRSFRIQYDALRLDYQSDLRRWAGQACDALTEAVHLRERGNEPSEPTRCRLREALSSLVDRGRWFFPNTNQPGEGEGKPAAFRGYRHEVLDALMDAYRALESKDLDVSRLLKAKQNFVSLVQEVLRPWDWHEEFARITEREKETTQQADPAGRPSAGH